MSRGQVLYAVSNPSSYEKGVMDCNEKIKRIKKSYKNAGIKCTTKDAAEAGEISIRAWARYGHHDKSYEKGMESALSHALTKGRLKHSRYDKKGK